MKSILIACECSGVIREAFEAEGWDAWSCDLKPSERPTNKHIQGDVREVIARGWDAMVGHPVCKFLTKSSERWMFHPDDSKLPRHKRRRHPLYPNRLQDQIDAIEFFELLQNAPIELIALENPRPMSEVIEMVGQPTQIVQPYWFGDPYMKTTCLWLKGFPKLKPEHVVQSGDRLRTKGGKIISKWYSDAKVGSKEKTETDRSRSFPGIGRAMARQWTEWIKTGVRFGELF